MPGAERASAMQAKRAKRAKAPAAIPLLRATPPRRARVNETLQAAPRLRWRLPRARRRGRNGNGVSPRAAEAVTTRNAAAATAATAAGRVMLLLMLPTLGRGGTGRHADLPLPPATPPEKSRGSGDTAAATGGEETPGRSAAEPARARSLPLPLLHVRQRRIGAGEEDGTTAGTADGPAGIGTARSGGTKAGATPGADLLRRRHGAAASLLALDPARLRRRCGGGPAPVPHALVLGLVPVDGGRGRRPPDGVTAGIGPGKTGVERTAETAEGETAAGVAQGKRRRTGMAGTAEEGTEEGAVLGGGTALGPARTVGLLALRSGRWLAADARGRTAGVAGEIRPWTTAEEDAGTAGSVGRRSATTVAAAAARAEGSDAGAGIAETAKAAAARPGEGGRMTGRTGRRRSGPPRHQQRQQRCRQRQEMGPAAAAVLLLV